MMKDINKSIHCKLEFLTPTHVGIGVEKKWQAGIDFYIEKGMLQLIDVGKTFTSLNEQQQLKFVNSLSNGELNVNDWRKHFVNRSTSRIKCEIDSREVQSLTRTGRGDVYLPGSSVKGALRSVMFNNLHKKDENIKDNEEAFGIIDRNLMQFLKIGDFSAIDQTEILRSKIFNLHQGPNWEGGWKHRGGRESETSSSFRATGFTTDFEVYPQGKTVVGRIAFLDSSVSQILSDKVGNLPRHARDFATQREIWPYLFTLINEYTRSLIDKEIAFFEKYETNETGKIIWSLNKVRSQILDGGTCVFRMGCGSGFYGMTGDWKFKDHFSTIRNPDTVSEWGKTKRVHYKSRKISFKDDQFMPLGFVKISIIQESEYNSFVEAKTLPVDERQFKNSTYKPSVISEPLQAVEYVPRMYSGPLKAGAGPIDAIVVKSGKPNKVKLMIEGVDKVYDLIRYSSEIPVDSIVHVSINQVSKTEILQVSFVKQVK